jgi:hypothetical protein
MILSTFQLIDVLEKMQKNLIEDTSGYGGITYQRIGADSYQVEGVAQINDEGKTGVIYIPKENG